MIVPDSVHVEFRRSLLRGKVRALNGLTLEVRDGDFFALVGQNGAGKSTAMYCFLGLMKPTSGKVEVMGRVPELGSPFNKGVAYLPEEPHYHLYLTVEEATRYYASLYGMRVSDKTIHDALERLGMAQFKSLPLSKCSKGMKQKVGIAQCLIHETRLLFLDEPTRGLDPLIVREFRETLREIHRRGATIVMNSHVLSEIEMLANRVAVVDGGKVVAQDDLRNFLTTDHELYSVMLLFLAGAVGLCVISSHLRSRCLKMVFTKPCTPSMWLGSAFLSAVLVSLFLNIVILGGAVILSLIWHVPVRAALIFLSTENFIASVGIIAYLMLLATLLHPALAVTFILIFNAEMFYEFHVWTQGAIRAGNSSLYLHVLEKIFHFFYLLLPMVNAYGKKMENVNVALRVAHGEWKYLLYSFGYVLTLSAFFYFLALFALQRKRHI